MAAGEGRRLRPLTERWAKPVLPIDGRPVLATLLHEIAAAGVRDTWIVVGHLGGQIERLVGDGSAFGLRVRYARQPEPLGSADAVSCALAGGARPPLLVLGADTVFTRGTIARARDEWLASGTSGGLAVRDVPAHELPERSAVAAEGGRLRSVVEKPAHGSADGDRRAAGAPLWFLSAELAALLAGLPGPPFELATAAERALAAGKALAAIPIGPTRDITRPDDVAVRNFPYLLGLEDG
jgi:NDP-sugar pyrophosphorylase family protein